MARIQVSALHFIDYYSFHNEEYHKSIGLVFT